MPSPAAGLILLLVLGTVEPLNDDVRARLAGAVDDGDYHDDAFGALVENVDRWTPGFGDARVRLDPDLDRVLFQNSAQRNSGVCRRCTGPPSLDSPRTLSKSLQAQPL